MCKDNFTTSTAVHHMWGCMGKTNMSYEWSPAYAPLRDVYGYSKKCTYSIVNKMLIVTKV